MNGVSLCAYKILSTLILQGMPPQDDPTQQGIASTCVNSSQVQQRTISPSNYSVTPGSVPSTYIQVYGGSDDCDKNSRKFHLLLKSLNSLFVTILILLRRSKYSPFPYGWLVRFWRRTLPSSVVNGRLFVSHFSLWI